MKPLTKSGDLVDFKEKLVFEEYKDKFLRGSKRFKADIKRKYNFEASSDLYSRLIDYQIKKYGEALTSDTHIEFISHMGQRYRGHRKQVIKNNNDMRQLKSFIERVEKSESKRTK